MKRITIIIAVILLILAIIPIVFRASKDIQKKLSFENTYAIQNVASHTDIRPYNAQIENGNILVTSIKIGNVSLGK